MNIEERFYSVTLTEEELRLFSEFLEQREYAVAPRKTVVRKPVSRKVSGGGGKHPHPSISSAKKIERSGRSPLTPSRHDLDMRDAAGIGGFAWE